MSISKFAKDNQVYFEFYPNTCFVKDQVTHQTLMVGKIRDGLYCFDPPQLVVGTSIPMSSKSSCITSLCNNVQSSSSANKDDQSVSALFEIWHQRVVIPLTKL